MEWEKGEWLKGMRLSGSQIVALLEKILNDYKLDCMYSKPL